MAEADIWRPAFVMVKSYGGDEMAVRTGPFLFQPREQSRRPNMKAQLTLIASALLLVSNIAGAQEQQAPSGMMPGQGMGVMGPRVMGHDMGMRVMMILMDTDGDGALSLEEVQTAHAKIFKVIDADKDGKVTMAEMQTFFRGGSSTSDQ
jgi:hypothetical protein